MLIESQLCEEPEPCDEPIVIGLVNNMPDTALRATERQFHDLLLEASYSRVVQLRHFSLPELQRAEAVQSHINEKYEDLNELWASRIDGLIVTGTEPQKAALTDEPYWRTLTKLIDWTADHTISTVWSCLAAHAAVLHLDGIERRRLPRKLSGVFGCVKRADHSVVAGINPRWNVPHSRYNDLPEEALIARGYCVLSRSSQTGVDLFVGNRDSLDVFFQGHPEYEAESLLLEYRRDIRRFLKRERESYPAMPRGCFDEDDAGRLTALRERVLCDRREELLADFPFARLVANARNTWQQAAVSVYRNWLRYLCARKTTHRIRPVGRLRQEHSPFEGRRAVCQ